MNPRRIWKWMLALVGVVLLVWYGRASWHLLSPPPRPVPTVAVERGSVVMTVYAGGGVEGGQSERLSAPMIGGGELDLTRLLPAGALVKPGDVVAQFDTTVQEYNLLQAQEDLEEAKQQVLEARATSAAQEEENRYSLIQAKDAVRLAALEVRRDPLLSAIDARKNELALEAARNNLAQLEHDLASQKASDQAAVLQQQATEQKAGVTAQTARKNIESMTLRAHTGGYVAIETNSNTNFAFSGMRLPVFQVGDQVNPGMAVAEIPDTRNWTIQAQIGELDRGHLAPGQKAEISFVGMPGQVYAGHVQFIGGTIGPPWNRHSDCTVALDSSPSGLRAGMQARVRIVTDRLNHVLWLPAQAVFGQDGNNRVYVRTGATFVPHRIKVIQRSESQVVIEGLQAGQQVALTNPTATTRARSTQKSAMEGLPQ